MNLLTTNHSYISRLSNVPKGALCRHTGMRSGHYGHRPTRFPQDAGLIVRHLGSHQQLAGEAQDVIFGVNDLMEVYK